ncbi:MAG: HYR domain-containing protein [Acidimicrobiales bacterium]
MRGFRRTTKLLALALVPLTVVMGAARADNLQADDLAAVGGVTNKTPGATGTARFQLVSNGSDGCNATATAPVTVAVSSNQAWLTFEAPSSLTLTACGTAGAGTIDYRLATTAPVGDVATISGEASGGKVGNNGFNNNPGKFNVTVIAGDTTPPVLTLPADLTAEATSADGAVVTYSASAHDNANGPVTPSCAPASGATFPLGQATVTCTATDTAGNASSGTFKVTVVDTTPPAVSVPGAITAEATSADGREVAFEGSAIDAVSGTLATACTPASGAVFPIGTTSVTCTATDGAGNTGRASFGVTVADTTAPQLTLPSGVAAEATGPDGAAAAWTATATDLVDGEVDVTCDPASATTFPLGATTVACSATDGAGNTATASFTVTVADTTAPDLDLPTAIVAEATGPDGAAVTYTAGAGDAVDGDVVPHCEPPSGRTFAIGTTPVSCSATDGAGNTATGGFDVTVRDTTAPTLVAPEVLTAEATSADGAVVSFAVTASDVVDADVAVTCSTPSGSTFPLGRTDVTCTATDEAGNTGQATFPVDVVDTTAPELAVPAAVLAEATGPDGAAVSFSVTAVDLVDGAVAVTCTPASGSTFALGTTTVGCSAADERANDAAGSFTVEVVDTTAPVVVVADVEATASGNSKAKVEYTASATDVVDGLLVPTCTPSPSGSEFPVGSTAVSCQATDGHGNTGTAGATIEVTYHFGGFYRPVDNPTVLNQVKAGQAIPVKFGLGGYQGMAIFAAGHPASGRIECSTSAPVDAIDQTVTAGSSSLTYDTGTASYHYVWKTDKAWAGTCRRLVLKTADGVTHEALFTLTR